MTKFFFPAVEIVFPDDGIPRRAAFYLAAEEYVARTFPEGSYLFSWILNKTVVIGRNQVAHKELDIDFCRGNGIDIIRRKVSILSAWQMRLRRLVCLLKCRVGMTSCSKMAEKFAVMLSTT